MFVRQWAGGLDVPGEAEFGEQADGEVGGVEFVPPSAVGGASGFGVVVVVPAFAEGDECDPPVVSCVVFGVGEVSVSPGVGGGVDEPDGVEDEYGSDGDAPDDPGEAEAGGDGFADGEEDECEGEGDCPVVSVDACDGGVALEVACVGSWVGVCFEEGPSHVGPEKAVSW